MPSLLSNRFPKEDEDDENNQLNSNNNNIAQPLTANLPGINGGAQEEQNHIQRRQEPLDGTGISDANLVEYEEASKKDLNRDQQQLLEFNSPLYDEIVKLESFAIPFTEDKYLGSKASMFIVMIIFCVPFVWTLASPVIQLNPPHFVYFDGCALTNTTYYQSLPAWFEPPTTIGLDGSLSFDECILCNGNGTNKISTTNVNVFESFDLTDLVTVFFLLQTLGWMAWYYYSLFSRTKRNEILLCYGIFIRPIPFSIRSMGGAIVIMSVGCTLGCSIYISTLTGSLEQRIRHLVKLGENANTDVCLFGVYAGQPAIPQFSSNNPCFGSTNRFNPLGIASGFLPFIPILLTLYRLAASPFKNISSLDVFDNFDKFKASVKLEVREDCFNEAVGNALDEKLKKESEGQGKIVRGASKAMKQSSGMIGVLKRFGQLNAFGVSWGTTLEEISDVFFKAKVIEKKKLSDEEEEKKKKNSKTESKYNNDASSGVVVVPETSAQV